MSFARTHTYIICTLLIMVYLALPATNLAYSATINGDDLSNKVFYSTTTNAPCDNCPCSDGQGSDCCDTTFCNCSCHAPLGNGLRLKYTPMIATQSIHEKYWSLPQIFFSIFVPPQNPA